MKNKKVISTLLAAAICTAILTACSPAQPGTTGYSQPGTSQQPSQEPAASSQLPDGTGGELVSKFVGPSLGEFTTQDVNGNEYTQDIFQDYDLTLAGCAQ